MSPRQMAIFTSFPCCPWDQPVSPPGAGMRKGLARYRLSLAPLISFCFLLRNWLKVSGRIALRLQGLIDCVSLPGPFHAW